MENGRIDYKVVLDTSAMQAEANKVTQSFSNMASQAQIEGAKIDGAFSQVAGNIGKAFAALTAAATFQQLSQKILQVRGEFQQLEVAFETMLGSAQQADTLMSQLVQTAATTPFGLQDVANGAKQLLAYGTEAEEVNQTLVRLGDIAAGLSIPLNDLVYLYGTTMTQGRLYTQDLRQFMGRGIPIVEELAKQFGVTKDEVSALVTAGKVGFPEVKKAIESLTDEGSKFGGLMEKQSHTISGQISNIEDALDMMFNDLGKSSEGVINGILSSVSFVVEHYETFGKILLSIVAMYGEYKAALMVTSAYQSLLANQEAAAAAAKEAALMKAIANAGADATATNAQTAATEANTAAKQGNISAIDQQVAATMRSLQTKQFEAEVNAQSAALELTNAQKRMTSAEMTFALRQQEYMAAVKSGDMSKILAARANLETAAKEKQNAATALGVAQKNADAAAATKEAAAQKLATFQTEVDTATKTANTTATGLWAAVTNAATAAWKGLSAAMANNPLGLALMGITAVITAVTMFSSETEEATGAMDRFRQAAADDLSKLETYKAILTTLPKDTKAYKDATQGAAEMGEKLGVKVKIENGELKDQEKTLKSLTAAVRKYAAEKVIAESAAESNKKAMESEKEAMDDLMDAAKDSFYQTVKDSQGKIVGSYKMVNEELAGITQGSWAVISQMVMANAQDIANAFVQGEDQGKEAIENQVEQIENLMAAMGISSDSIDQFHAKLYAYVQESAEGFAEAYGEMDRTNAQLRGLEGQTVNVTDKTVGMAREYSNLAATAGDTLDILVSKQIDIENQIAYINAHPMSPDVDSRRIEYLRFLLIDIQGLMGDIKKGSLADLRKQEKALKEQLETIDPTDAKVAPLRKELQGIQKAIKTTEETVYGKKETGGGSKRKSAGTTKPKNTSGSKTKKSKGSTTKKDDPQDIAFEVSKYEKSVSEAAKKLQEDLYDAVSKGTTSAMEEGNKKVLQQIKDNTKDQLDSLDEQVKELMKKKREEDKKIWLKQDSKRKERDYVEPPEESIEQFLTRYHEVGVLYRQRRKQIEDEGAAAAKKVRDEESKEQKSAMEDYLAQYGNYTQKRKALAAKAAQEILDAETIGEKMDIARRLQEQLSQLDMEEFRDKINWEVVFNDLDKRSIESLKKLKEQLRQAITDKNLSADDAKTISDQIDKINEQLISRQSSWRSHFGLVIPELEKQKQLIQEAKDAQEKLNDAQERQTSSQKALTADQKNITDFLKKNGKEFSGSITTENAQKILDLFKGNETASKQLETMFTNLAKSEGNAAIAANNLGDAQEEAAQATENAQKDITNTIAAIDQISEKVNSNIQSAAELVETLGLSESGFGKGFSAFAESSQHISDAWEALKSGNIMGVANGVVGSLRSLGEALGEWGIGFFGSSDKDLIKDIERLTYSNEALEGAVSRLTKTMEQQAGSDLAKTYQQAVDDLNQAMVNTKEMLARSGAAYNSGFFGIGGKGSANYKIGKLLSTADWQRISQLMGKTITDVSQIWELSSEELGKLAENAPDIWAKIKQGAADGYKDISDYLDAYVEYYDKLIELQQQYNESLTQTSFDNIKSGLADLISDTETDAYDVINNVSDMMQKAILNIVLTKTMKPKLDKWYEDFANAMADDTLTAMENAALEQGYTDIYKQAKEEVDRAYKLAGIDPNTGDVEDASTGAWSALGEETGRSLDGRMTAIHIQVTKIADMMSLDHEAIGRMDLRSMQDSTTLNEMHNLIFLSTEHLERVARNSDALPQINSKLEQIRQNTDRL